MNEKKEEEEDRIGYDRVSDSTSSCGEGGGGGKEGGGRGGGRGGGYDRMSATGFVFVSGWVNIGSVSNELTRINKPGQALISIDQSLHSNSLPILTQVDPCNDSL